MTTILNKVLEDIVKHPVRYFVSNMFLLFSAGLARLPHLFLILFAAAFVTTLNFLCYIELDTLD